MPESMKNKKALKVKVKQYFYMVRELMNMITTIIM